MDNFFSNPKLTQNSLSTLLGIKLQLITKKRFVITRIEVTNYITRHLYDILSNLIVFFLCMNHIFYLLLLFFARKFAMSLTLGFSQILIL
ncbi:hypothetical protein BpHYR1_029153 [Brachionus plicatilis]|uniref:Uncharacterized protein n=1 Tax=Brachionus plicatilis TaxID=10195 RepID=A0A3M7PV06_BRAPC|nr:hypothetical protein BpHYR1_029153 [Brachionus plicatilis]